MFRVAGGQEAVHQVLATEDPGVQPCKRTSYLMYIHSLATTNFRCDDGLFLRKLHDVGIKLHTNVLIETTLYLVLSFDSIIKFDICGCFIFFMVLCYGHLPQ